MTFISNLEIIQLQELIWFCFESQNCRWSISVRLSLPQSWLDMPRVNRENARVRMDWSLSIHALCFLWTSPWKAPSPSQSFESCGKHQLSWSKAKVWALFYWMQEIIPEERALGLGIVMLLIAWEKQLSAMGKTFPSRALCIGSVFQEVGGRFSLRVRCPEAPGMRLLVLIYAVTAKV